MNNEVEERTDQEEMRSDRLEELVMTTIYNCTSCVISTLSIALQSKTEIFHDELIL